MRKFILTLLLGFCAYSFSFGQSKTIIGIMPFRNAESRGGYSGYNRNTTENHEITAIQDAVTDAFVRTKRFSLVEREKMEQIKSEKQLQKNEDFIDGVVIEQSKSLGAQYIVMGNVSKASHETNSSYAPIAGRITTQNSEVAFNIKVVDVATGEIMASGSFSGSGRGKNAFEKALEDIIPDIEKFIGENFKVTMSVASVEEKNGSGDAVKLLVAGGTSMGVKAGDKFKVYESTELTVDGKKLARKITIGKVQVVKVEDENFCICSVIEGGGDISKKISAGAKIKCEAIYE